MDDLSNPTDKYLILGHGIEELIEFNDRPRIPKGITLITIAQCGIVTTRNEVCPMVQAFTRPENAIILENPQKYKDEIKGYLNGKDFHYYIEGDQYPKLSLQMFIDWPHDKYTEVFKSGTYKFPLKDECDLPFRKIGPYKDGKKLFERILPADYSSELMYKDSIKPLHSEVNTLLEQTKDSKQIKKRLTMTLEDIFKAGGPGIYYYVVCRSIKDTLTPKQYVEQMQFSENNSRRYEPYFTPNWISHIPELLPLLNSNIKTAEHWEKNIAKETRRNYERLQRVPIVRRKSINQQVRVGGRRKTKRKSRKVK